MRTNTHLEHNVVLQIGNEVNHLVLASTSARKHVSTASSKASFMQRRNQSVDAQMALVQNSRHTRQLLHRVEGGQVMFPRVDQHILKSFDFEQQSKYLQVPNQNHKR